MSATVSQAEFARMQGWSRPYVTALKQADRLVMVDGQVDVAASLQRLAETDGQQRPDVRERNARQRLGDTSDPTQTEAGIPSKATSTARKEHYAAEAAAREHALACGELAPLADVEQALAEIAGLIQQRLQLLPASLAPLLAIEADEQRCRLLLTDEIDRLLHDLADQFAQIGEGAAA